MVCTLDIRTMRCSLRCSSWWVSTFTTISLYFHCFAVITPEPRHFRHAQEIVDRLQTHTASHIFRPKALYDGQAILFASHQLNLSGGGSGNVNIHFDVKIYTATYTFYLQFNVSMSDRPPPPGAPARGVYSVKLTRAAAQAVEFS